MRNGAVHPSTGIRAFSCIVAIAIPLLAYDLQTTKVTYVVSNAHLDTQWKWSMQWTIDQFLPNTLRQNFALLRTYPDYVFNFEGAFRYVLAKQHYPGAYDTLKQYVAQGRWHPVGGMVDACDVNIPCPEALMRQFLYGNGFFEDEFGKRSSDVFLPDCFGFGYALPTIAVHCGIIGFSTQKLGWAPGLNSPPYSEAPFDFGMWEGVDGSRLFAALGAGGYGGPMEVRTSQGDALFSQASVWATYDYIGTGDVGGAPSTPDVAAMVARIAANGSNDIKVYNTASDQMFRDMAALPQTTIDRIPVYKGELTKTLHGVGCYTSHADIKRLNWLNEQAAMAAEGASAVAMMATGATYPAARLKDAWFRFLKHQFHDDLTGTSVAEAYTLFTIPAEDSSLDDFSSVLTTASGAVAAQLDTRVPIPGSLPVVVYNPLGMDRRELLQTTVSLSSPTTAVVVYDSAGTEIPSQVISAAGQSVTLCFVASVPSVGYAVYFVKPSSTTPTYPDSLNISSSVLENEHYRVAIDANGDISGIRDKQTARELLSAPSRLELRNDNPEGYPAWEIRYADVNAQPRGYVDGAVQKQIAENGPVRVSLKVTRTKDGSTFTQWYRLSAGGDHLEIVNEIDWKTQGTLLKASFPFSASNPTATFDLGLGVIERPNMVEGKYEVPGQQWADITNTDGTYGAAVLNEYKRGWDKASNNILHLTLIHSPTNGGDYSGDQFMHSFRYGVYGHTGGWRNGVANAGMRFNAPLIAFATQAHAGTLGRSFSLVKTDHTSAAIMCVKKAEHSEDLIVRVRELNGTGAQAVPLTFARSIRTASEVNGMEDVKSPVSGVNGSAMQFAMTPFQPKSFAVTLSPASVAQPRVRSSGTVMRPYRVDLNGTALSFEIPANSRPSHLTVRDLAGRSVFRRSLDNRDDADRATMRATVPAGMYVVTVSAGTTVASLKALMQ